MSSVFVPARADVSHLMVHLSPSEPLSSDAGILIKPLCWGAVPLEEQVGPSTKPKRMHRACWDRDVIRVDTVQVCLRGVDEGHGDATVVQLPPPPPPF